MRKPLDHIAVLACIWYRLSAKQLLPMQFAQFYQKYCCRLKSSLVRD